MLFCFPVSCLSSCDILRCVILPIHLYFSPFVFSPILILMHFAWTFFVYFILTHYLVSFRILSYLNAWEYLSHLSFLCRTSRSFILPSTPYLITSNTSFYLHMFSLVLLVDSFYGYFVPLELYFAAFPSVWILHTVTF